MTLTKEAKAVIALTTRLGSRQRPSLTAKMWHELSQALADAGHRPDAVFDEHLDFSTIPGIDDETSERITRLTGNAAATLLEVDDLANKGIWTRTVYDDDYPPRLIARLGHNAPPVLFGSGDLGLLARPGVGIVGSRNVSPEGGEVARALARQAVGIGMAVVSGGARGVDQLAMDETLEVGGSVVGVLADSLIGRIRKPDVLQALDEGGVCLVTQQAPSSGFTPAAAMARNKVIYGLSAVTVVVASDEDSGGTWAGAKEALKTRNGTVAVWRGPGEGPGNEALQRLGAGPIRDTSELEGLLDTEETSEQMSLDLP